MPANENYVIDLTGAEDPPINPLQPAPPRPRRRRRTEVDDDDDEIEVVSTVHYDNENYGNRHPQSQGDIEVVDEKVLTPQEKLKLIQERHSRGEFVNPNQRSPRNNGILHRGFHPAFRASGFYRPAPSTYLGFDFPHQININTPSIRHPHNLHNFQNFGAQLNPYGPYAPPFNFEPGVEQAVIERTLQASLENYTNSKPVDVKSIIKPPEPADPRPGFTRSLDTPEDLVCIKCNNTLGVQRETNTEFAKIQSPKVFVRGCGHVYCGECTHLLKLAAPKDRACPVADCKKVYARKRGLFREVFL